METYLFVCLFVCLFEGAPISNDRQRLDLELSSPTLSID